MGFGLIGVGAALAFAAIGSAIGTGAAGMSSIGAWKKCYLNNKPAPFMLVAFTGVPLTQTIYGFILMRTLYDAAIAKADPWLLLGAGVFGGIAMGFSAMFQGKAGACASDALAETGKGAGQYFMIVGIIETVALFVMVFLMVIMSQI